VKEKTPLNLRKILFGVLIGTGLLTTFILLLYWLYVWRFEESTSDAYVGGNQVEITSQISGIATAIYVENTHFVEEGELLAQVDPTDYAIAFEKSRHLLAEAVREVRQLFIQFEKAEAFLKQKDVSLLNAQRDYENRLPLVGIGGVSKEEFEHIESAYIEARAIQQEAMRSFESSHVPIQKTTLATHPLVQKSSDDVRVAFLNLQRCSIRSPVTGYVAQRTIQVGEHLSQTVPLMVVIPLDQLWVNANFKEVQLAKVRIGQKVTLSSDLYGKKVSFTGKVEGITPGTGSVFSLLPPQNATGNWIKIVQRVPVRISLSQQELKKHPLWLGLSMNATVDIHDSSGAMVAKEVSKEPIYATSLYQKQIEGVEAIINQIIKENSD